LKGLKGYFLSGQVSSFSSSFELSSKNKNEDWKNWMKTHGVRGGS
jgi:hypothetical protein